MSFDRIELDGGNIVLYRGDCMEVLPTLPAGSVDACVTDTPYGLCIPYASYDDTEAAWTSLMLAVVPEMRRVARFVVMPSCQIKKMGWWYANLPPDWLIAWYKGSPGHQSNIGFNDWEPHLAWGKPYRAMHDYFHAVCGFDNNGHPCPKPLPWATWLVKRAADLDGIVADPFMGSGTTGVACIRTGRKFIGIEIDEGYFEIARKRIQTELDQRDGRGPLMAASLYEGDE